MICTVSVDFVSCRRNNAWQQNGERSENRTRWTDHKTQILSSWSLLGTDPALLGHNWVTFEHTWRRKPRSGGHIIPGPIPNLSQTTCWQHEKKHNYAGADQQEKWDPVRPEAMHVCRVLIKTNLPPPLLPQFHLKTNLGNRQPSIIPTISPAWQLRLPSADISVTSSRFNNVLYSWFPYLTNKHFGMHS